MSVRDRNATVTINFSDGTQCTYQGCTVDQVVTEAKGEPLGSTKYLAMIIPISVPPKEDHATPQS